MEFELRNWTTWDRVSFWTILSLPTLIFRVDKANLKSPRSHPISLATVCAPVIVHDEISLQTEPQEQEFIKLHQKMIHIQY